MGNGEQLLRPRGPKRGIHHLDRRVAELIEQGAGDPDELIDTKTLARWLGVSPAWAHVARHQGRGPTWVEISRKRIRYRRRDVWAWLDTRRRTSTRRDGDGDAVA